MDRVSIVGAIQGFFCLVADEMILREHGGRWCATITTVKMHYLASASIRAIHLHASPVCASHAATWNLPDHELQILS
jgi:hypothetical protein